MAPAIEAIPDARACRTVYGERNDRAVRDNPLVVEEAKFMPGLLYSSR